MKGTELYMAPEILDLKNASKESDMWGLGVVLYEMC
jgi:serine/threonine protein kinase